MNEYTLTTVEALLAMRKGKIVERDNGQKHRKYNGEFQYFSCNNWYPLAVVNLNAKWRIVEPEVGPLNWALKPLDALRAELKEQHEEERALLAQQTDLLIGINSKLKEVLHELNANYEDTNYG